ncbi:dynein axonemal assembly factor 3 [Arctopsyche grandis]|uniref:dynein axonemal assembly factor 3 n=1 Tax=Arctopsyche grandis TaxID=121162 RepID=UPI00406D80B0
MYWGLTTALDLQEEYTKYVDIDKSELNIILIGGCDGRHVLKTIAQMYRHKCTRINFHIIEGCLELIARQLMLLSIALENPRQLGLLEKTRLYLEIYGNTLIRQSTSKYMIFKSKEIIKMITDLDYMAKMLPNVSFEGIKYRERDYIEMLLQFWRKGNTNQFNICELWDKRIRAALGTRYDAKFGVFDWDYNMRFKDIGGAVVSLQEFKHFRNTGVAFTWLEVEVCRPNYTLAAGVLKCGDEFCHRGYIGDIITGPYIAFGLDCIDKYMMQVSNRVHVKRSTDISERNIMRMMYEVQSRKSFDPDIFKIENHNLGLVTTAQLDTKMSEEIDGGLVSEYDLNNSPSINIEGVTVSFHSPSALNNFTCKEEFRGRFDVLYVSQNFVDKVDSCLMNVMSNDGVLIIESRKFIINMKKDDIKLFESKIEVIEQNYNCMRVNTFNPLTDDFVTLRKK